MKNLDCCQCSEALALDCTADEHDYVPAPFSLFLSRKNNGWLVEASYGVQKIITLCEKIFREKVKGTRKDDMRINSKEFLIRKMTTRFFFYKEPTSRPSSKSSLFVDLKSANSSTKSSLIVP